MSHGSAEAGAGIFLTGGALWTDSSTSITSNTATTVGGAIFNTLGGVFLGGSTISNNTAAGDGGAIIQLGALVSQGVTFSGNTAGFGGGAVFNVGTWSDTGSTYTNNSITQNSGDNSRLEGSSTIVEHDDLRSHGDLHQQQ